MTLIASALFIENRNDTMKREEHGHPGVHDNNIATQYYAQTTDASKTRQSLVHAAGQIWVNSWPTGRHLHVGYKLEPITRSTCTRIKAGSQYDRTWCCVDSP